MQQDASELINQALECFLIGLTKLKQAEQIAQNLHNENASLKERNYELEMLTSPWNHKEGLSIADWNGSLT